jgi:hypothetical protein
MKVGKMKKITILIHIDALRHDYITKEDMPFLYGLSRKGIKARLIPPFGFEPDGAYLTGTYPDVYEGGMHFIYNEGKSVIPCAKYFPSCLDKLNIYVQYPIRRFFQWFISKIGHSKRIRQNPFIGQIPFKLLKYFDFCDYLFVHETGFCKEAYTLFDYLRNEQMNFFYHGAPEFGCSALSVKRRFLTQFKNGTNFIFLLIADLDGIGHIYGPNSEERQKISKLIDHKIYDIYNHLLKFYNVIELIAFGDHGMAEVKNYVDFRPILKSIPLTIGKDYIYFLDSTFARFWFFNDKAKKIITDTLKNIKGGTIISEKDKSKYRINYKNRKFGDAIFWIDGETMIFPNFWHVRSTKKGMHGYREEVIDNHASFIYNSSEKDIGNELKSIEMADVFQTTFYALFGKTSNNEKVFGKPVQVNK